MDRFDLYYRLSLIWLSLLVVGFTFVCSSKLVVRTRKHEVV